MMPGEITYGPSPNPNFYIIYLNGRAWRLCPINKLSQRYPEAKEITNDAR